MHSKWPESVVTVLLNRKQQIPLSLNINAPVSNAKLHRVMVSLDGSRQSSGRGSLRTTERLGFESFGTVIRRGLTNVCSLESQSACRQDIANYKASPVGQFSNTQTSQTSKLPPSHPSQHHLDHCHKFEALCQLGPKLRHPESQLDRSTISLQTMKSTLTTGREISSFLDSKFLPIDKLGG